MAPDLNSVPPSPRPPASSEASFSQQPPGASPILSTANTTASSTNSQAQTSPIPPMLSANSIDILPSNQSTVNQTSPPSASPSMTATATSMNDNTGVGIGPGPLRHPRPLTAADLHLQLEKEQEAVVNRLTRDLSMLRAAQNASVVSNTSSTSAGLPDSQDHNANHLLSGPSHPTPSQRQHHRSSSSTSTRGNTNFPSQPIASSQSTTADRARGNPPRHESISLSRQNSSTIIGAHRSGRSSPAPLSSSYQLPESFPYLYQSRTSVPNREPSVGNLHALASSQRGRTDSNTSISMSSRHEEITMHRQELEAAKRENDALKRRVRELERTLRIRTQSDATQEGSVAGSTVGRGARSESVSTTASVSVPSRGRDRARESLDDVAVGESALSGRLE